jgi:hypothetical protein
VAVVLARQQEPIWLTGGSIGLSSLGTASPEGAKWWWKDRIVFVFVRHIAVQFSFDALSLEPIWGDPLVLPTGTGLPAGQAVEILRHVIGTIPRYRHLVNSFHPLAALDTNYTELLSLQAEAEQGLAAERHAAEKHLSELRAAQSHDQSASQEERSSFKESHSANGEASWDTLIIPQSLRENLQAYCRTLRDHLAYRAQGVQLPKGLLLYWPPETGKTQCAKTLATEGGLNFVSLSTSDCKQMWLGFLPKHGTSSLPLFLSMNSTRSVRHAGRMRTRSARSLRLSSCRKSTDS